VIGNGARESLAFDPAGNSLAPLSTSENVDWVNGPPVGSDLPLPPDALPLLC
jgi:hypothetical protein